MYTFNVKQATRTINNGFTVFSTRRSGQVIASAINDTAKVARTDIARLIVNYYDAEGFTVSGVKSRLIIERATARKPWAVIRVSNEKINLAKFRPRVESTGVSVQIVKGKRKTIRHAFIPKLGKGGKIVAARTDKSGGYSESGFSFRKTRTVRTGSDLLISDMVGISIPQEFAGQSGNLMRISATKIDATYKKRLTHHLIRAIR